MGTFTSLGQIVNPDGVGKAIGNCGEFIQISFRARGNIISEAKFYTNGCKNLIACSEATIALTKGKTIQEVLNLTPDMILDKVGGLPESKKHCAELAIDSCFA